LFSALQARADVDSEKATIQELVQAAELIIVAQVETTYRPADIGMDEGEELGAWLADCKIEELLKGEFADPALTVTFSKARRTLGRPYLKLENGRRYLLFLKKEGGFFSTLTRYKGAYEEGGRFTVYDAASDDPRRGAEIGYAELLGAVRSLTAK
jgi:hypothetical protein